MDGLQDGTKVDEGAAQQQEPQDSDDQKTQTEQIADTEGGNAADKARTDYEVALRERDERIAAFEGEIAEVAKTAESAEALRKEMDELRRQGEEQRIGFELQMAGARNVKAAKALLADYEGDVEKLKAAEPWLFGAGAVAPAQAGATGLPNAGAAGVRRVGLPDVLPVFVARGRGWERPTRALARATST